MRRGKRGVYLDGFFHQRDGAARITGVQTLPAESEIPHGLQRRGSNLGQWSRTLFHRGQRLAQSCPKPLNYSIELSQNLTCSGRDVLDTCQILAGGTLGAGKQHIAVTQAADRT